MLILTRKIGESIMIGDDVVVQVMDVQGRQVRIGVAAPREVLVDRAEIREKRESEKWEDRDGNS